VIGRVFFYRVLAAIAGAIAAAERELDDHLLTLQQQEMIRERAHVPELEYIFKHQLTQEAAYNGLLKQERRVFHRQVAEVLERLFPDRIDEQVGLLAHHWQRAEVADKAIPYLLRAGSQAVAAYANEEAIEYLRQALALLDKYAGNEQQAWQLEAFGRLGQAYHAIGRLAEAEDCFRKAIAIGQDMGITPRELVRLYYWLCDVLWWQGRYDDVIRQSEDGLALLGAGSKSAEAAMMYKHLGGGYVIKGEQELGLGCADEIERFLADLPYEPEIRSAYTDVALVHRWRGDIEGALTWLRRLEALATPYHDLRAVGEVHHWRGGALFDLGDLRGAMREYRQAIELFDRIGDIRHIGMLYTDEAGVHLALGDPESARHCADRALEIVPDAWNLMRAYIQAGYAALCQGASDEALDMFQKADLALVGGDQYKTELAYNFGQLCLAHGERAEAFRHFEHTLTEPGLAWLTQQPYWLGRILDGLEQSTDPETFHALCRRLGQEAASHQLSRCFLSPAEPGTAGEPVLQDDAAFLEAGWSWVDPLGDCAHVAHAGLEIRASNGRDLLWANQSAPRLVRPVEGDWAAQVTCSAASTDLPAAGGLLLWKDQHNHLRLDVGQLDRRAIVLIARVAGRAAVVGRGRLPLGLETQVWLRLERTGKQVRALCSQDGRQWFGVGQAALPAQDPVQVGVYAAGNIEWATYRRAYPAGTAIRFTTFRLAKLSRLGAV
ncbi:MAG: tetratricopeptide repeat protein, partial [Thermoflexales bacterium]|nr:tetratricopeptide repeat protein [Thermoflexales bacterium]